jgi:hypothetical protein
MKRTIQTLFTLLVLAPPVVALGQGPQTCGVLSVEGPGDVKPGETIIFKAQIRSTALMNKPALNWKLTAGTIVNGQGTNEISVDTAGLGGQDVTATLEMVGVPVGCSSAASRTTRVSLPIACGLAFDQYGDLKFEDEKARLDNFAVQIQMQPTASGYIGMYAGAETYPDEASERLNRAKTYLVDFRKTEPNRVITVDCGFSSELTVQLYIVPFGASLPACDDNQQIPLSEVKFTKQRPKSRSKARPRR